MAAHTGIKITDEVLDLHPEMLSDEIPLLVWSEGCAAQFTTRFVFQLIARMEKKNSKLSRVITKGTVGKVK